jgi:hypothetical protein
MTASGWQLNRFERILFWIALTLGAVLVLVRLGSIVFLGYLSHIR